MASIDPRVDDYISKSAEFARPILSHLRQLVHTACPEVKETIKWSFPNFEYAGAILCSMAAFKQHCTFGFWLGSLMPDPDKLLEAVGEKTSMGHLGQIKSLDDLPKDEILIRYIREAMVLNEKGVKVKKEKSAAPKNVEAPSWFLDALQKSPTASVAFEKFSPSHRREYIEWVTEAKTEATRSKRLATAIEWMTEGKTRNWKYAKC
ncbi:YdeI/OmpD-associated family protein [Segetibacter aerophilus]|uniref:YdhG-like domain-containing protein n=1 Tax=Segetibacter aerophilus TaxID=670293 RepID=A0A512BJT3_9BACT|nr:DUF1801 domain-containing protein [Segetibacter aerophilus]GEO12241.1 hypothetical protein SAE01_47370 [Segetibacter aerophilus]